MGGGPRGVVSMETVCLRAINNHSLYANITHGGVSPAIGAHVNPPGFARDLRWSENFRDKRRRD